MWVESRNPINLQTNLLQNDTQNTIYYLKHKFWMKMLYLYVFNNSSLIILSYTLSPKHINALYLIFYVSCIINPTSILAMEKFSYKLHGNYIHLMWFIVCNTDLHSENFLRVMLQNENILIIHYYYC